MVKINYWYADDSYEQRTADTLAAELVARYPDGAGVPGGMRIARNGVDITATLLVDQSVAFSTDDAVYDITVAPGDPLTAALVVIAVVVSVVALTSIPKIAAPTNANRNQQSPNNSLSNRSNTARVNERAADIRGYVAGAYVDLLQLPYRKFVQGTEIEYIYGQISEGYVQVENIRDGDTLLSKIQGAGAAVYGPGTSPLSGAPYQSVGFIPEESLYTVVQSNEVDGVILKAPNAGGLGTTSLSITATSAGVVSVTGSTVDFTTFLTVGGSVTFADFFTYREVADGGGSLQFPIGGQYTVSAVTASTITIDTTPEWSAAFATLSGPQPMRSVVWNDLADQNIWYTSNPGAVAYQVTYAPSIDGVGVSGNSVGPIDISGYARVWLNVVARNGLFKDNGDTVTPSIDAMFSVTIRQTTETGAPTGLVTETMYTVPANVADPKLSTGITVDIAVPYDNAEILVKRTGNTDTVFAGTVVDEIQWRDLYLVNTVNSIDTSYATTIHAQIRATESALRVKERKLNCDVTRRVAPYSGGTFGTSETEPAVLFAPVLASICRDPLFGRMRDDEVDWAQLFALQTQMISYYGSDNPLRVGYTFDSDNITAEDAIRMICDAVNVRPYRVGSVLQFYFERPQATSAMSIGHRHKHPGSDERVRTYGNRDDKTGVELTYYNASERSFDVVKLGSDVNPLQIELSGCITKQGANIRARREYAKLLGARVQHKCDLTAIGRLIAPGMRVDVVDNTRAAVYDGEIKAVDGLILTLSQPVTLATPTDYAISLTMSDGMAQTRQILSQPAPNQVIISGALTEAPQTGRDADRTPYVIGNDDMRTAMAMTVVDVVPTQYDKVSVSFINYDSAYYDGDLDP
jgi:hypothetical protein